MTTNRARDTASAGSTRHAGIERDDVIDAALALVESGGGDALTMRKLAAELGVATTTIYWHVGNRDDLVLAVVAAPGRAPGRDAGPWRHTRRAHRQRARATSGTAPWRTAT